jgi:hypothetical protein
MPSREELRPLMELPDRSNQPSLRIYTPTAEYLLAMKCMAMRVEGADRSSDIADIRNLLKSTGLRTSSQLMDLVERFFPKK